MSGRLATMAMVGAAISATSEVVGMATGAGSMAQTSHLYKGQLAQTKCYFAAGWAEASWRHAEALNQAERHHLDDSALGRAAIHQTEKIHQREMEQANLLDQRNYEITVNSEIRENARDVVTAKTYEFNNIMLCDTVCLGCAFAMVIEGIPPEDSGDGMLTVYMIAVALSLAFFFISLWMAVILANVRCPPPPPRRQPRR